MELAFLNCTVPQAIPMVIPQTLGVTLWPLRRLECRARAPQPTHGCCFCGHSERRNALQWPSGVIWGLPPPPPRLHRADDDAVQKGTHVIHLIAFASKRGGPNPQESSSNPQPRYCADSLALDSDLGPIFHSHKHVNQNRCHSRAEGSMLGTECRQPPPPPPCLRRKSVSKARLPSHPSPLGGLAKDL